MKLNKLLVSLALVATGSVMVACGSGSTGSSAPAAPAVTPLELPAGFVTPAASTSGIGYNVTDAQIAIPAKGTYNIIQLTVEQAVQVAEALNAGGVISQQANGEIVIAAPASATNPTTQAESVVILAPQTTQASTQSKALQAIRVIGYNVSIPPGRTTQVRAIIMEGLSSSDFGIFGTLNGIVGVNFKDKTGIDIPATNTSCPGIPSTIAVGVKNNNAGYISWGTSGEQGKVCVADVNTLTVTNLTAEAPAADSANHNGYQGGVVNYLGFASTQGTGQISGFWNVNNQIYKVFGNSANSGVTAAGFLNTTSGVANQKSGGTAKQTVTFSGFPTANTIYSTYVDQANNVWVGTNNAKVYVLRNGATQWTEKTPTQFANATSGNVTVSPQANSDSGATATVPNLGGAIPVSLN